MTATATPTTVPTDTPDELYQPIVHPKGLNMAERVDAEIEAYPLAHQWVAQATISIDYKTAKRTNLRGSFRSEAGMRIDALETMCVNCRRPFDAVGDKARCEAQIDNTHLIGGDLTTRAKRNIPEIRGPIHYDVIHRRGMAGYSVAPRV